MATRCGAMPLSWDRGYGCDLATCPPIRRVHRRSRWLHQHAACADPGQAADDLGDPRTNNGANAAESTWAHRAPGRHLSPRPTSIPDPPNREEARNRQPGVTFSPTRPGAGHPMARNRQPDVTFSPTRPRPDTQRRQSACLPGRMPGLQPPRGEKPTARRHFLANSTGGGAGRSSQCAGGG
jgi:hypothetical protein